MHGYSSIWQILPSAIFVGFVSFVPGEQAQAHTMHLFAYAEAGKIRGEVFARGGSPIVGATITAYGPGGETLAETKTDDAGEFSLVPTKRCDWRLVAVAGDGHQAEYTVPSEELPPDLPEDTGMPAAPAKSPSNTQTVAPALPDSESAAPAPPADGTAELSRQVSALRRELNQLRDELRWQDTIGGVGYILGLMGLTFYFLGVQKRNRNQTPPKA